MKRKHPRTNGTNTGTAHAWISVLAGLVIVALSLVPLTDLTRPGLPVTHDGRDHVARIANFYGSLTEGNIVPRWAANLNWGYGHPILMFLYPLPSYAASAFHAAGFSYVDSMKLVFASAFVLSMVFMYAWGAAAFSWEAGMLAAVLYGFAPYRFVDLYVRGAIGEHMAFVFPPLLFLGLLCLSRARGRGYLVPMAVISLSVAFLILSHNALSLLFLPVAAFYALYLLLTAETNRKAFVAGVLVSAAAGFLFSAFYWIPAFFEGKYTLRDIVTSEDFRSRFVSFGWFIWSPWNYGQGNAISKWLGAGQIAAVAWGFFVLEKAPNRRRFLVSLIVLLVLSLFIQTSGSLPLWNTVTLLQKFQFPWRFLSVSVLLVSVIGAVAAAGTPRNIRWIAVLALSLVSVFSTSWMWRAKSYVPLSDSSVSGIYDSTTDTGESSPVWSVRFMERRPEGPARLVPAAGSGVPRKRTTTERSYLVTVPNRARFIEHTLYFPGWQVSVNGKNLPVSAMQFQDPAYRGLMTFEVPPGSHRIRFLFTQTRLRQAADTVSAAALALAVAVAGTILVWPKSRHSR